MATLDPRPQLLDSCEVRFLNRVLRWIVPPFGKAPERIEVEADPRRAELIQNSGLQSNSKGVHTPGERPRDSLRTVKRHHKTTAGVEALKRSIRFLLKYPRFIQSFERQEIGCSSGLTMVEGHRT